MKVQHKTMFKFKMSYSNLSKSQEIELRDSISDKTSGQRGSVATPICSLESNTCLVWVDWGGIAEQSAFITQHSSLILLSLLDTWVNELWEIIVSISFYLSAWGSQSVVSC